MDAAGTAAQMGTKHYGIRLRAAPQEAHSPGCSLPTQLPEELFPGRQLQGPGHELREPNAQGREDVLRASIPGSDGNYAPEWMELQQCDT